MIFRNIIGVSSLLTAGFVSAKCGIFNSTKWSSPGNENPFQITTIGQICPMVSADSNFTTQPKVADAMKRLRRETGISDFYVRELSKKKTRYFRFIYEDFLLYFDKDNMNPAIVYEFMTPVNFQGNSGTSTWRGDERFKGRFQNHNIRVKDPYRKGHMAARGNHTQEDKLWQQTFHTVNAAPMNQCLNEGVWEVIEEFARGMTKIHGCVHTFTGPLYRESRLGSLGKVRIPTHFFKVIIVEIGKDGEEIKDIFAGQSAHNGDETEETGYAMAMDPEETKQAIAQAACPPDQIEEEYLLDEAAGGIDTRVESSKKSPQFHLFAFLVPNRNEMSDLTYQDKRMFLSNYLTSLEMIDTETDLQIFRKSRLSAIKVPDGYMELNNDKIQLPREWTKEFNKKKELRSKREERR